MRVLVIGDPHFKKDNSIETDSLHSQIEIHLRIQESPYDFIVCLGDVVDQITHLFYPLERINSFFKMLIKYAKLYVLIGNHDRPNNQHFLTESHPFGAMKMWPGDRIVIVDRGLFETINGRQFLFVPYVPPGRFEEALRQILGLEKDSENFPIKLGEIKKSGGCIFSHQEFYSSLLNVGIRSTEGDKWSSANPVIINGHIHKGCLLQNNILHVGTPYEVDMGDLDPNNEAQKGLVVLRFDSATERGTPFADSTISYERVPLAVRRKISIETSAKEFIASPNTVYSKFAAFLESGGNNHHIRLVISQSKDEKRYIDASKMLFPFENLGIRIKRVLLKSELAPSENLEMVRSEFAPRGTIQGNFKEKLVYLLESQHPELLDLLGELSFE